MTAGAQPWIRPYEAEAERLWEEGELRVAQIADRFGVTKNTIIGLSKRRGWSPRQAPVEPRSTTESRLQELHRRMDSVLEESRRVLTEHPPHLSVVARNPEGYARWLTRND